jgi:hypothetical protein
MKIMREDFGDLVSWMEFAYISSEDMVKITRF